MVGFSVFWLVDCINEKQLQNLLIIGGNNKILAGSTPLRRKH